MHPHVAALLLHWPSVRILRQSRFTDIFCGRRIWGAEKSRELPYRIWTSWGLGGQVIVVVGMAFEARIAAGAGVSVICSGDGRNLAAVLARTITQARASSEGCRGVVSFGVAGGLAPDLKPGT